MVASQPPQQPADALLQGLIALGVELPFNRHLGVEVAEIERGRVVTRLPDDSRLHNHLAGVHAIAELAPVELAGALAASSRLQPLLERGYVPVVGYLSVHYLAAATGELVATAVVGEEVLGPALATADAGERPRVEVRVEVHDLAGTLTAVADLRFVYLEVSRTLEVSGGAGQAAAPEVSGPFVDREADGEESPDSTGQDAG